MVVQYTASGEGAEKSLSDKGVALDRLIRGVEIGGDVEIWCGAHGERLHLALRTSNAFETKRPSRATQPRKPTAMGHRSRYATSLTTRWTRSIRGLAFVGAWLSAGCDVNLSSSTTSAAPDPALEGETELTWQDATLTHFESYPDPGSSECIDFSGCDYAGHFAAFPGIQQSREWVESHNIAAVHSDDFAQLKGKTLRIREGGRRIDVKVYDLCSDSDCDGCCSQNRTETGFLIDLEINTADRFGVYGGVVQWACLDC